VSIAFVGLGSNTGDRLESLSAALRAITALDGVHVLDVSRAYESEPWGVPEQPLFANAVARLDVRRGADALLVALKGIEEQMGRLPTERFGPRIIDLDVLLYGDEEWAALDLVLPHPRLLERDFVVTPLLEIAPLAKLPDGTRVTPAGATAGRVVGDLGPVPGFERP
jgi:2-amino-4-hydroxy-6-hydroxymethyldihydropteridine diphosphokinase